MALALELLVPSRQRGCGAGYRSLQGGGREAGAGTREAEPVPPQRMPALLQRWALCGHLNSPPGPQALSRPLAGQLLRWACCAKPPCLSTRPEILFAAIVGPGPFLAWGRK